MSAPAIVSPDQLPVASHRQPVPPYAAPAVALRTVAGPAGRVGPYVPAAWRQAPPVEVARDVQGPEVSAPAGAAFANVEAALEVPARIPPYSPLRPTPISVPAMRTPLYIPTLKTPESEAVVADEGEIAPELVHTTEFAVPPAPTPVESSAIGADLPWIDAFLAATPAAPVPAVAADDMEPESDVPLTDVAAFASATPPTPVEETAPPTGVESADEWPLDEAAAEFHALSSQLEPPAMHEPASLFADADADAQSVGLPPLPAWSDDEFMDIMPVHASARGVKTESERTGSSSPEAPAIEASAEEAARALEVLARRVRDGELALPGYDPRMGEPAALVAALAALLGVRLR